jgi:hypothetical protein
MKGGRRHVPAREITLQSRRRRRSSFASAGQLLHQIARLDGLRARSGICRPPSLRSGRATIAQRAPAAIATPAVANPVSITATQPRIDC